MRSVYLTHGDKQYRVEMDDDHPALIYRETPDGEQYASSIWPFHYESQKDSVVIETVRRHLDAISRADP